MIRNIVEIDNQGSLVQLDNRNWEYQNRRYVKACNERQVWRFIWARAMEKVEPDKRTLTDSDGSFRKLWSQNYGHLNNPLYKKMPWTNSLGFARGKQVALGRALGYSKGKKKYMTSRGYESYTCPHQAVFSGWNKGSKPQGKRAKKLLKIAGFKHFAHAMFCWASAGNPSRVHWREPLVRKTNKQWMAVAQDHIKRIIILDDTKLNIHTEIFTVALDALAAAGATIPKAIRIATDVARPYLEETQL